MTSEFKPCKNCGSRAQSWSDGKTVKNGIQQNRLNTNDVECFFHLGCNDCGETLKVISAEQAAIEMNTRAVPDVPELDRYTAVELVRANDDGRDPIPNQEGDYVLHSQAAEIIAADRAEIKRLRSLNHYAHLEAVAIRRAEAAEATLAQYEAQKPVAFIANKKIQDDIWLTHVVFREDQSRFFPCTKLYASPAPAADLKAENDRFARTIEEIHRRLVNSGFLGNDPEGVLESIRAAAASALNPSEPRT